MSNFTKKKILHRKKTNRNKRRQTGRGLCGSRSKGSHDIRMNNLSRTGEQSIQKLEEADSRKESSMNLQASINKMFIKINMYINMGPLPGRTNKHNNKLRFGMLKNLLRQVSSLNTQLKGLEVDPEITKSIDIQIVKTYIKTKTTFNIKTTSKRADTQTGMPSLTETNVDEVVAND
jgi:hypothetical protein